ncbi:hypothetical protein EV360DRAFT_78430 [Lentinula raphanica]|nr:hypothetical protein EV360DRAFT_78430 [Lentinula raphanica]
MSLAQLDPLPLLSTGESDRSGLSDQSRPSKQISDIKREVLVIEGQISDIEHKVLLLQGQIRELARLKDAKNAEIAALQNELLPIHRLPSEIISLIFEEACRPSSSDSSQENSTLTAAFIPRVCVAWMKISYATPSIWSQLHLNPEQHYKAITSRDPSRIRSWLSRSGSLPIDLDLNFASRDGFSLRRRRKACQSMTVFLEFRERIRSLVVRAELRIILPLFRLPPFSFPRLEMVDIHTAPGYEEALDLIQIRAFAGAPNLKEIRLREMENSHILLGRMDLPIEQLTALQIDVSSAQEVQYFDILSRCAKLTSLDMCMSCIYWDAIISDGTQIALPSLQSLSLSCHPNSSLVRCITAPLVTDLRMTFRGNQDIRIHARDLVQFQHRSSTTLTSLTLTDLPFASEGNRISDGLTTILSAFPSVSIFQMDTVGYYPATNPLSFQGLTYTEGSPVLLPKMSCLKLIWTNPYEWGRTAFQPPVSGLMDMILSRTRGSYTGTSIDDDENKHVVRLRKVTLCGIVNGIEEQDIAPIRDIPGLDVIFSP